MHPNGIAEQWNEEIRGNYIEYLRRYKEEQNRNDRGRMNLPRITNDPYKHIKVMEMNLTIEGELDRCPRTGELEKIEDNDDPKKGQIDSAGPAPYCYHRSLLQGIDVSNWRENR